MDPLEFNLDELTMIFMSLFYFFCELQTHFLKVRGIFLLYS